jgi:glycosyltransferase involved in cell wall biosynthesis
VSRPLLYVAYPMRLDLGAANAIQTYSTVQELRIVVPQMRLVVPRWPGDVSAFEELGAIHLPRPAVNKLSRLVPWAGWSYIERTLFAGMLVVMLAFLRIVGAGFRVLYVRDSVCAAWLSLLKGIHGAKVVYEVHDLETMHPSKSSRWPPAFWRRFLRWVDRTALRRSCKVVSLTETFRRWAVSRRLRAARDIAVIPDAFDPALYLPLSRDEARRKLDLPADAFIVGYAGLTFAYRRLDLLVEAFAHIAGSGDNMLLLLVGGRESEVRELREQARKLGIDAGRIVTPGQVSHEKAALYLQASDVLVIPDTVTQMTASPLKLFEYMAAGKPVVLRDLPALREIVDDDSAEFFPGGDALALAASIVRLMRDSERSAEVARNAHKRSQGYTYRARAEKIVEVVKSCR